jgi:hypothetical protein
MILNITSYPRSGNSFFTTTLLAFDPVWKVNGRPVDFKPLRSVYTDECAPYGVEKVPFLNAASEDRHPLRRIKDETAVFVYKRHDHPDDYTGPRIYLVRDGRDVITSYAHHNLVHGRVAKNLAAGLAAGHGGAMQYSEKELHDEMRHLAHHSKWGEFVLRGVEHSNVLSVVKYEDMKKDPVHVVREALRDAGIVVLDQTEIPAPKFENLHKSYPWFYRQGKVKAHRDELPRDIQEIFESVPENKEALQRLEYL